VVYAGAMMDESENVIVEVVVDLPLEGVFDYAVPERLRSEMRVGRRVSVLFNRAKRVGVVTRMKDRSEVKKLNWILAVLDQEGVAVDDVMMDVARRVVSRYGCAFGQAVFSVLPPIARKNRDLICPDRNPTGVSLPDSFPKTVLAHDLDEKQGRDWIAERIREVLTSGRTVLMLVPEAVDVSGMVSWLQSVVICPIGRQSRGTRIAQVEAEWRAARSGDFPVWVGTRSAVFTPLPNLGLLVVAEEEHPSYQEEQSPYYHVREVAWIRQAVERCEVIFWSAAPSVEIWHEVERHQVEKRMFRRSVARFNVVDMSNYNLRTTPLLAPPTQNRLTECLRSGGRALFIVQSRDFQSWTHPQEGTTIKAKADKVEAEIRRFYAEYSFERHDEPGHDVMPRARIVLGPPSIIKSHHRWRPEMIGVIRPDARMHQFDYRSAQRVFAFFVQLCLWAKDVVMIQTMLRDQYPIRAAETWDFDAFYREELRLRKELELPPFWHMARVCCRGSARDEVDHFSQRLYEDLRRGVKSPTLVQDPFWKTTGNVSEKTEMVILCKSPDLASMVCSVKSALTGMKKPRGLIVTFVIDY
jgi:primosomal protein N' (replication factor Y) (superfamily II helicase)